MLLALECGVVGVSVRPFTVKNPNAGLGLFAALTISKGNTIEEYYGSLEYRDHSEHHLLMKECGDGTMAVWKGMLNTCSIALSNMGIDLRGIKHSCWMVAAPFCAMGSIHKARCLTGNNTHTVDKQLPTLRNNVLFRDKESSIAGSDLTNFELSLSWQRRKFWWGKSYL